MLNELKKALKEKVDGKVMVREDKRFAGWKKEGIDSYNVYFDTPTPSNREVIAQTITEHGFNPLGFHIQAGTYGYIIGFNNRKEGK